MVLSFYSLDMHMWSPRGPCGSRALLWSSVVSVVVFGVLLMPLVRVGSLVCSLVS